MATLVKFDAFTKALAEKKHNLSSDSIVVQLMNTAPTPATNAVETDLPADLSTGSGYTAGGVATAAQTGSTSSGTYKLVIPDLVITSSGTIGPFRYVVLLNNTATNKDLIGYYDYGSSITLANGETFTIDFDGAAGVLTIA